MKSLAMWVGVAAIASLGSGCFVDRARYDELEARYKERETALLARDQEVIELRRNHELAEAETAAAQKEIGLYRAKLEAKDVEASLRPEGAGETTVAAGLAIDGEHATSPRGVGPAGAGFTINPATGGIVLEGGVIFTPGSATLRTTAAPILDKVVAEVNRPEARDLLVRIDGHTDDTPISKSKNRDNWDLSGKRALAVLNYLEDHGVAPERLSFAGFGAQCPFASGSGKTERAQNRRVEVVMLRRK